MTNDEKSEIRNRVNAAAAAFGAVLSAEAARYLDVGDDFQAGKLLAFHRRLLFLTGGEPAAAPAATTSATTTAPGAKCRHDFRDAHGADSDVCIKCDVKKRPNGRKRVQQLIPAAPAPLAGLTPEEVEIGSRCDVPGCRNLVPSPGLPYCEPHRKEKTQTRKRGPLPSIPKCEVQSCRNFAVAGSEYCDAHRHLAGDVAP